MKKLLSITVDLTVVVLAMATLYAACWAEHIAVRERPSETFLADGR